MADEQSEGSFTGRRTSPIPARAWIPQASAERECHIRRAAAEAACVVAPKRKLVEIAGTGMVKPRPCDRMAGGGSARSGTTRCGR